MIKSYETDITFLIIPDFTTVYYFTECCLLLIIENGLNLSIVNNSLSFFAMQLILIPIPVLCRID